MAAPTFVAYQQGTAGWASTTTPKTTSAFGSTVPIGDVLVGITGEEQSSNTLGTPTNSGTAQTWTQQDRVNTGTVRSYGCSHVAIVGTALSSPTVSETGPAHNFNIGVFQFTNSLGSGAHAVAVATTAGTVSITTQHANSAIVVFAFDQGAQDGTLNRVWATVNGITPTAGNGLEKAFVFTTASYSVYGAYYPDAGAPGAKTVGVTTPSTSTNYTVFAVEVLGTPAAPALGDAKRPPIRFPFPRRRGAVTSSPVPAQVAATAQALPVQPTRRMSPWGARRGRVESPQPVQPVAGRVPAQPIRRRGPLVTPRRAKSAIPVPVSIVVTAQPLPPQTARRRVPWIPRPKARTAAAPTVTVRVPILPERRLVRPTRRRGFTASPPPPPVVVTVQVLPPQPVRRQRAWIPRGRVQVAQPPVAPLVVVVVPVPQQPGRRRPTWIPRSRVHTSQPVPVVAHVVVPVQPVRRPSRLPVRHGRASVVVPPVVITAQALPPQPERRLAPWFPRPHRGVAEIPVPFVVTVQPLPPQPGRRRLFVPPVRRSESSQPVRISVTVVPPAPGRRSGFLPKRRSFTASPPVVRVTVVPAQPVRSRRVQVFPRKARSTQPVPLRKTAQALPVQPVPRRLWWFGRRRAFVPPWHPSQVNLRDLALRAGLSLDRYSATLSPDRYQGGGVVARYADLEAADRYTAARTLDRYQGGLYQ